MKRILIVDDNTQNLYLLRALLAGHGYAVEEARNGEIARVTALASPPDMVISDLFMPVLDGYGFLRFWKADERLKNIPFVVYTATYTDPRDESLALEMGADAFILKPLEPEPFLDRLREILEKAGRGELGKPNAPAHDKSVLLEAQTEALIRKLEKKAAQLEDANRELMEEISVRMRAEKQMGESEMRFRELAETIQEVFWMYDPARKSVLYVNPAYEKIWGRTCISLYQTPSSWSDAVHPEDRERIRQAAESLQIRGDYDETYRILRPDGTQRWIRDRAYPVRDESGAVVRVVGTAEDITDRRQLEERIHQAHKLEAIGQLAAGVAHDFNNILAVILGNAELAQAQNAKGRPVERSLEEITKASVRGKSLVKQILTFSRQQPQARQIIDLAPILEETVEFLRAVIPSNIDFVLATDPASLTVLADPTQVHQVISNLCTNAWHALEGKPGRILIKLESIELGAMDAARMGGVRPGLTARLTVSDTGKGMDAATLERIFDPFFTTKGPGKGTGLGLSVVQGIVQEHDGAITVASQPGQGTTIQVYFPAAESFVADWEAMPESVRGQGQHVLYLDDEEALVLLATPMLERLGYRVTGFTDPAAALKAFHENPNRFDLVITDMNMPGESGLGVAMDMLKLRPELPIALCSGFITEDLRLRAQSAGIRDLLYKPGTLEEFGNAIHKLVISSLQG
jgi:PAS domain S-box-containing protein